ncbi:hypothetical protein [Asticcacaulis taihuensis]|uniref:hypothetical protein n=1 Tax=Asticcacaulis taihuensis TaxID=260084 RepID=UPI003F7C77DA
MQIFISLPLGEDPAQIETTWDIAGIKYQSHAVTAFSVGAADYAMLIINSDVAKLAVGALAGWIAAKQNRRVSIRIDGKDFSANNVKELEKVIELASKVESITPIPPPATSAPKPDSAASPPLPH